MNYRRRTSAALLTLAVLASATLIGGCGLWSRGINLSIPRESRPERIVFAAPEVTDAEFEQLVAQLLQRYDSTLDSSRISRMIGSREERMHFDHIERFRKAGIRAYEGPKTCQTCHKEVTVPDGHGGYTRENLRRNIETSVHFTFNRKQGFSTWGFNGERVDDFPLGKIDRACGIPGSFTWTGWAALVKSKQGTVYSEGCGQCHMGGQYGPSTGTMMPGYKPTKAEYEAVDCLICHARDYDMNRKQVIEDPNGRLRWDQDRSVRAMLSIEKPTSETCLRCHQHNHGGDFFVENTVAKSPGYDHPRLLHHGAKRGTPYKSNWDVHASAGMECTDCHATAGHRIARGTKGTDLVGNDLPGVEVSCEKCHTAAPHTSKTLDYERLNEHTARIACETCHIRDLMPDNIVLRDWTSPVYAEDEGLWVPNNVLISGAAKEAITFRWFNGEGTFMAGALGDNPNGEKLYRAFETTPDSQYAAFDYAGEYERVFRPIAASAPSKIYPFKRFNARMYEDLNNQGPYGGMLLPFDYPTYYETGNAKAAMLKAVQHPIIQKMYGWMFKMYMMNQFMEYMKVDGWNTHFSAERTAPRWMRQEATLMINHGIVKNGHSCADCHTRQGNLLNFEALGYTKDEAATLGTLME